MGDHDHLVRGSMINVVLSNDSLARTVNGQRVSRVVDLRMCFFFAEGLCCQDLSHAYITIFLPLVLVVDFPVINA